MTPEEREAFHDTRKEDCEASLIMLSEREGRVAAPASVVQRLLNAYGGAKKSLINEWSGEIDVDVRALQVELDDYANILGLDAPSVVDEWQVDDG